MKLAYRLAYFSGGFIMGLLILFFILSGKKTSCAYGPEARTLKNISKKKREFSPAVIHFFAENKLDSSAVDSLLLHGDVIFSESETHLDSCNLYVIKGRVSDKNLKVKIENCNEIAKVYQADIESEE